MNTQEETTQTILNQQVILKQAAIAKLQTALTAEMDHLRELEKAIKDPKALDIKIIGKYKREEMQVDTIFFTKQDLETHIFTDIDKPAAKAISDLVISKNRTFFSEVVNYGIIQTQEADLNDVDLINYFQINTLSTFKELLGTAQDLVQAYLQGKGLLVEVNAADQANVDLGYCFLIDENGAEKIFDLYLETFPNKNTVVPQFHLHAREVARKYKKGSFRLIKK